MRMSRKFFTSLLALFVVLFSYPLFTFAALLTTSVDRPAIAQGQRFNLVISIDGRDLIGSPDLSALQKDFEVLGTSRNQSIVMINGNITRKNQWIITLIAKRSGRLTIPPVKFGGLRTHPVIIAVTTPSKATVGNNQLLLFKATVDKSDPYVQSQVIYTLRLYYNVTIMEAMFSPPVVKNGIIKPLGRDKRYQGKLNGRPIFIYERRYVIFPQLSGELKITPAIFSGNIRVTTSNRSDGQDFFGFNSQFNIKPVRLFATPITLNVRKMPETAVASWWLPAKNINISERWSQNLKSLTVGQPLTRTITIKATGLTSAQLPIIKSVMLENMKSYPGEPKLIDRVEGRELGGSRIEKIVYIPSAAGDHQIPAINIPWWNTELDRGEIATLPAQSLHIVSSTSPSSTLNPIPNEIQKKSSSSLLQPPSLTSPKHAIINRKLNHSLQKKSVAHIDYWFLAIIVLVAGQILLFIFWRLKKGGRGRQKSANSAISRRQRLSLLKKACYENKPKKVVESLLEWVNEEWPEGTVRHLGDLSSLCDSIDLKKAIDELDEIIYSKGVANGGNFDWDGEKFWERFKNSSFIKGSSGERTKNREEFLPTLYLTE